MTMLYSNLHYSEVCYNEVDSCSLFSSVLLFSLHKTVSTVGTNFKMQKHITALWS